VASGLEDDAALRERLELRSERLGRLLVADPDARPAAEQEPAESLAGPFSDDETF
jgi:hypothetical protein